MHIRTYTYKNAHGTSHKSLGKTAPNYSAGTYACSKLKTVLTCASTGLILDSQSVGKGMYA
jgi:hypothetical protein